MRIFFLLLDIPTNFRWSPSQAFKCKNNTKEKSFVKIQITYIYIYIYTHFKRDGLLAGSPSVAKH